MLALEREVYVGLMALGFGAGAFGTLIGAGGGFVLMPVLLLFYPHDQPEVLTSISLAVVFFNALSGSEAYALAKRIDYRSALAFALATIPGAVLGSLNTTLFNRRVFDPVFGVLVLAVAGYLFLRREHPARERSDGRPHLTHRVLVDAHGTEYRYSFDMRLGLAVSFLVGYLSSLFGIGGGIIHVPFLVTVLDFPVHVATATSHLILAVMALAGTLTHVAQGTFAHGVHRALVLSIGVVAGAQVGARLSEHIRGRLIIRLLALGLGLLGLRVLLASLF